jgi:uncharacterized protein YqeY
MAETPQQRIEADLKTAMKAREAERVSTLRMLLADLKNERIRRGEEVDETAFLGLVRRGIKQRQDAAEQFEKGGRPEQAAKERRELEDLEAYLPAGPGEEEIRSTVEAYVAEHGLAGPAAMGQVMPAMIQRFAGRADNAVLSRVVRDVLQKSAG